MIKKILSSLLLITVLVSCGGKKAAYNYSQDIVMKERSLEPALNSTESKIETFANTQQFDSIVAVSSRMEKMVQEKIEEVEKMKVPKAKHADEFRKSALDYFRYIKSIYTGYIRVAKGTTDEERQAKAIELQELVSTKEKLISSFQSVQRKYAEANGFRLEK